MKLDLLIGVERTICEDKTWNQQAANYHKSDTSEICMQPAGNYDTAHMQHCTATALKFTKPEGSNSSLHMRTVNTFMLSATLLVDIYIAVLCSSCGKLLTDDVIRLTLCKCCMKLEVVVMCIVCWLLVSPPATHKQLLFQIHRSSLAEHQPNLAGMLRELQQDSQQHHTCNTKVTVFRVWPNPEP